ncbi:putative amino acid ABC transporter, substrate binding protein [Nocardioides phosphati]|uniref:Amino acid ABC transporter, substrate binding protein n=1 Tax=Nocardioides phosphati TaxID=1867775 RepID=A0ABQ2NAC2_9ACTN|nr:ABC transporter substrate-binding protein [Nocardioides phosphati]GGO88094.1 putative amino acid ABC transporter, substrate binding protein [Nocardioides phosphati]
MLLNRLVSGTAVAALALGLAGCGGDPTAAPSGGGGDTIVVGSAAFGESEILAEIYAQALEAKGVSAKTHLDIGAREAYVGAIKDGSIDLVPDYTGNLLLFLDPKATASAPDDVNAALTAALPKGLSVLTPSAAEDKDSLNVTAAFAAKHHVASIADLANVDGLKLAANPEFKTRAYGLPGLAKVYGVKDVAFTGISDGGGPATVKALTSGRVDVADIYSTTPAITANKLVTLEDPKHLIAAQNVVPLIRDEVASAKVKEVLDAVSAKLTTEQLLKLNADLAGDSHPSPADVAKAWLKANDLA